jgi:hypothetical protein
MTAEELERKQTEDLQLHVENRWTTWSLDPLGNRLFKGNNKFMVSISGYDCVITVEFQDPR